MIDNIRAWWRYEFCWRWRRRRTKSALWIARHLPKSVRYWSLVDMAANGSPSRYYPGTEPVDRVMKRYGSWSKD